MNVFAKRTVRKQSGAALLAFLLVFVTAASFALVKGLNETATQHHRDAQTAKALAEAKAALIGYAVGRVVTPAVCSAPGNNCPRPGDLPCPDRNNDGLAEADCGAPTVPDPSWTRLGRLPSKTLGLPDLRDGAGERLWYAVSRSFREETRLICGSPGEPGCLNSDAQGAITLRAPNGNAIFDASIVDPLTRNGVVAVVIAPGAVLRRLGSSTDQNRICVVGVNCTSNDVCTTLNPLSTPKCHPRNYLDRAAEDNRNFYDGNTLSSRTNGFIQGKVYDASGNLIVNDHLLPITYQDLMPLLENRVVGEVLACLKSYASRPANSGRYPWAAPLVGAAPSYVGVTDTRFGRVPDDSPSLTVAPGMEPNWPNGCDISAGTNWWLNWKELVFYGVADAYKPTAVTPSCASSSCLKVFPPSPVADRQVVVLAAGKRLADLPGGQPRNSGTDKGIPSNYLEDENASQLSAPPYTDDFFTAAPTTTTFNDVVCKQGIC